MFVVQDIGDHARVEVLWNGKLINLKRPKQEVVTACLRRLGIKLTEVDKAPEHRITFVDQQGAEVHAENLGQVLANAHQIRIDDTTLTVTPCPSDPTLRISTNTCFTGLPVFLRGEISTDPNYTYGWYLVEKSPQGPKPGYTSTSFSIGEFDPQRSPLAQRINGDGTIITVPTEHVGKLIVFRVGYATLPGLVYICVSHQLESPPPPCVWNETRFQGFNQKPSKGLTRVCSWNILAPVYAESSFATTAMFPHCPAFALSYAYRKPSLAKEILRINADLFTFQECASSVYDDLLCPLLATLGFAGHLWKKCSDANEGVSTFWRTDRWKRVETITTAFRSDFPGTSPHCQQVFERAQQVFPTLAQVVPKMTAVAGVVVLEEIHTQDLWIIGNTHLYWHPDADHIRALQSLWVMTFLDKEVNRIRSEHPERNLRIILCGDLNSDPGTAAIELIQKGNVSKFHSCWGEQQGSEMQSHLTLENSQQNTGFEFTNHVGGFKAVLDWIFVTPNMKTRAVLPAVPVSEIEFPEPSQVLTVQERLARAEAAQRELKPCGLPTVSYPSDHIPVVSDLELL